MRRLGAVTAVLLVIGSACTSSFVKDNPQLCSADKIQAVKDAVAKDGLTPQVAAGKVGTDARCLSDSETRQAQATYTAYQAQQSAAATASTQAPTAAPTTAAPTTSATATTTAAASTTPAPTPATASTQAPTEQPSAASTEAPATPTPTPAPTLSPTPSPSPSPTVAAGDAGWPPKSVSPIQSNEAPITGRVVHANGTGGGHYCLILTSGPCAATTDGNGNFTLKFASGFGAVAINIVVKGRYDPATGDGPVVAQRAITMTATGVSGLTITVP